MKGAGVFVKFPFKSTAFVHTLYTVAAEVIKRTMLKIGVIASLALLMAFAAGDGTFKATQLKNARVKAAYTEKWKPLQQEMKSKGLSGSFDILLCAFKQEKLLEVWLRNTGSQAYTLLKTYPICATSGDLGPKRREGDGQIPEGFYTIDLFNPNSDYYLSLRISYPNRSDNILSDKKRPGGAIMIHGNCVTIGCIPITDEKIKELYVLAVEAKNAARNFQVHIYPCRLTAENLKQLEKRYSPELMAFWRNLKTVYDYFLSGNSVPFVRVAKDGKYYF